MNLLSKLKNFCLKKIKRNLFVKMILLRTPIKVMSGNGKFEITKLATVLKLIAKNPRIKNPNNDKDKGHREFKHFQFLTDEVGEPRLREFFGGLIALARATTTWSKYKSMVNRAYPVYGKTLDIGFPDDDNEK